MTDPGTDPRGGLEGSAPVAGEEVSGGRRLVTRRDPSPAKDEAGEAPGSANATEEIGQLDAGLEVEEEEDEGGRHAIEVLLSIQGSSNDICGDGAGPVGSLYYQPDPSPSHNKGKPARVTETSTLPGGVVAAGAQQMQDTITSHSGTELTVTAELPSPPSHSSNNSRSSSSNGGNSAQQRQLKGKGRVESAPGAYPDSGLDPNPTTSYPTPDNPPEGHSPDSPSPTVSLLPPPPPLPLPAPYQPLQVGDPGWEKTADRPPKKLPIRFQDAFDRRFIFPWEKAKTWDVRKKILFLFCPPPPAPSPRSNVGISHL